MTPPDFLRAYRFTRVQEGGYWPGKPGDMNPTDRGVTQHAYDDFRTGHALSPRDVRQMTEEECQGVYQQYWEDAHCPQMPTAEVALLHFDMGFNAGTGTAAKMLQRVVGVTPDGAIGPATIAAVTAAATTDHKALLVRLTGARATRFRKLAEADPLKQKFLVGWLRRVSAIQKEVGV